MTSNTHQKGRRNENKAKSLLSRCGFNVDSQNYSRYGSKDLYNLFDAVAMKPDSKVWWIQVKSNVANGIRAFSRKVQEFVNFEHNRVFYFVWHDYQGFRIIEVFEDGSREVRVDERNENKSAEIFIKESC